MSMEPFDYLTYKKNKSQNNPKPPQKNDKLNKIAVCSVTFAVFFIAVMYLIASRSSKMDIEYGRLGKEGANIYTEENAPEGDEEEFVKPEKFTIDKRLFLIRQEEKGPSESRVIQENKEQSEVISKEQFDKIRKSSEEISPSAEDIMKSTLEKEMALKKAQQTGEGQTLPVLKPVIKPKVQTPAAAKPASSLEPSNVSVPAKVLIGRYTNIDDAREMQAKVSAVVQGGIPYVKRVGAYYTVQVGAYENFETAKAIAGKLHSRGFEAWILQ